MVLFNYFFSREEKHKLSIILGVTVPLTIILVIMAFVVAYFCHKRAQNNMKAAEYTAKITGFEEIEVSVLPSMYFCPSFEYMKCALYPLTKCS